MSEAQSFAETALRMGGKSEEEATRMGAVDKADEQVEKLFAERLRTTSSPVHRAVWDGKLPLDLFSPAAAGTDRAVRCGDGAVAGGRPQASRRRHAA